LLLFVLGVRTTDVGALVSGGGAQDDDKMLLGCLERVSYVGVFFSLMYCGGLILFNWVDVLISQVLHLTKSRIAKNCVGTADCLHG
jgi:Mg2+/citrate symporter